MPGNVLRKCIKPIFDAYTLPSNLQTSVIHQHYTQEIFKFEWVWFIELNRTEHFCYKPFFKGLLGLQCNLQSLICPSWHLGRTLCPRMSQRLGGVVHPDLTFGEEFNHSKYPVSSFPKRKGGIRLSVSVCSLPSVYLCSQLPAQVLLPWSWASFAHQVFCPVSWCVQMSWIDWNGSNGMKCPYSIQNYYFFL